MAGLLLALVWIGVKGSYRPGCELRHSLWRAGKVSDRSQNDLWIEYGAVSLMPVALYRDFDGDGLVDECLAFSGPVVAVYRASNNDGVLDTVRGIGEPLIPAERVPRDSPEAGPFTRAILDERVLDEKRGRKTGTHAENGDGGNKSI
jgi:hypothetical protein